MVIIGGPKGGGQHEVLRQLKMLAVPLAASRIPQRATNRVPLARLNQAEFKIGYIMQEAWDRHDAINCQSASCQHQSRAF